MSIIHRTRLIAAPQPGVYATEVESERHYPRHWHTTYGFGLIDRGAHRSASPVGAVDVSTDGGQVWNPASGREQWTYQWLPTASGTFTIKTRAVDDSGNLEQPQLGLTIIVL